MLTVVKDSLYKAGFKAKAESPSIAIGAGIVGFGVTVVLSSRATLKAQEKLKDHREALKQLDKDFEEVQGATDKKSGEPVMTVKDYEALKLNIFLKTSWSMLKLYGPTLAVAGLSIAGIVYGRNSFKSRLSALSSAYSVLSSSFDAYRKKVEEKYGADDEHDVFAESQASKLPTPKKDEAGNTVTVKVDPNVGVYSRFFDETSCNYRSRAGENRIFVSSAQSYFNDLLYRRGYLYLNEVYSHLGIETTPAGQYIGWYINKKTGHDSYVDFGLGDVSREGVRRFVNDDEPSVLLTFNVDGYILDKI